MHLRTPAALFDFRLIRLLPSLCLWALLFACGDSESNAHADAPDCTTCTVTIAVDSALAGIPDVVDCGSISLQFGGSPLASEDVRAVRTCVSEALIDGLPATGRFSPRGIDSEITTAYLSTGAGVLDVLRFDSAPFGGRCSPRLTRQRCASPTFVADMFECDAGWEDDVQLCDQSGAFFPDGVPAE